MIKVMSLGDPVPLFSNQDFSLLTDSCVRKALQSVQDIPADQFLNTPTDDIVAALVEDNSITPPTLKADEAYIDGPHEIEIRRRDYGEDIRVPGTLVALIVPIEGDTGLLYNNPNRYGHVIRGNLHYNNLILTIRGQGLQAQDVDRVFKTQLKEVEEFLGLQRGIADQHRSILPSRLKPVIEQRKAKLLADRNMIAGLSFAMKPRADSTKTYSAPVARKKIVPAKPATAARS